MTVPGRVEAAELLLSLDPPAWLFRHLRAVAEVAGWLATRIDGRGERIDRGLVEAAALLHDADKALRPADPAGSLPHGDGSAAWLVRLGHPELAGPVAAHPVTRLLDADTTDRLLASPLEVLVVAYADKRAGQRLEPMADRFGSWRRRYPNSWSAAEAASVEERAGRLERLVCAAAGVLPDEVRRLAWTGPAVRRAVAARSTEIASKRAAG
jgi:hypothetical protein